MEKSFMDPVHGFIVIDEEWLLQLVDTPEFQRLRRIRQLGVSSGTYHGAEHTRFGHSLGAFSIMGRVLRQLLAPGTTELPELDRKAALAAALLHDVGHAPFSHALERLLTPGLSHEQWSMAVIEGDTAIGSILRGVHPDLPRRVRQLIAGEHPTVWLRQLVASQLDVDRFDYLLRDSLYTGTGYGRFDLERIIHTLRVAGGRLVLQIKGLQAAEEYVLARHFMYWRVYLHKTIRVHELMLRAAVRRAHWLWEQGASVYIVPALRVLWQKERAGKGALLGAEGLAAYLALDDVDILAMLKTWGNDGEEKDGDTVLADLARRVIHRDLLKPVFRQPQAEVGAPLLAAARQEVERAGWDPDYYCLHDTASNTPYDAYRDDPAIWLVREAKGQEPTGATELAAVSPLIQALTGRVRAAANVYVPASVRAVLNERWPELTKK